MIKSLRSPQQHTGVRKILDWQELAAVDKMGYLVDSQMAAFPVGLLYNFHWVGILEAFSKNWYKS